MAIYAPGAIRGAWDTILARIPTARFGGIFPATPTSFGYHNARYRLPAWDYSVQRENDRRGSGWAASALDVTMGPADMAACTQRLITATQNRDPRLQGLRSFLGTINGRTVTGMDVRDRRFITSDLSHLWHIHLSFYRWFANNAAAMQAIADVFTGVNTTEPPTMLQQVRLFNVNQNFDLTSGVWRTLGFRDWGPANMSGGASIVLPAAGGQFIITVFATLDGLPPEGNLFCRIQTLDRMGNQRALFPIGEYRGTTGLSHLVHSQVGSIGRDTNLRALVAATHDCRLTSGEVRCLY